MELIADVLEPGRDPSQKSTVTRLYVYRSFAERCDKGEARALAKMVNRGELTAQHVAYLLTVEPGSNSKTRAQLLAACLKNGWGANELRRQIQSNKRHGPGSAGGRRFKARPTTNAAVAAREVIRATDILIDMLNTYFSHKGAPLQKLPKTPGDLSRDLTKLEEGLSKVLELAADAKGVLRRQR